MHLIGISKGSPNADSTRRVLSLKTLSQETILSRRTAGTRAQGQRPAGAVRQVAASGRRSHAGGGRRGEARVAAVPSGSGIGGWPNGRGGRGVGTRVIGEAKSHYFTPDSP